MAKKIMPNWDRLTAGAALSESKQTDVKATVRAKNIPNMPLDFFERHAALKADRKTTMVFTAYIIEAVREKLERDETR